MPPARCPGTTESVTHCHADFDEPLAVQAAAPPPRSAAPRLGPARFEAAVRRELPRWNATRPCLRIVRAVYAALRDPAGVMAHRPGALERAHLVLGGWR